MLKLCNVSKDSAFWGANQVKHLATCWKEGGFLPNKSVDSNSKFVILMSHLGFIMLHIRSSHLEKSCLTCATRCTESVVTQFNMIKTELIG
jgi:hypothetical protein